MLLQFSFRNFKSFRDNTTLDLTATKISEYGHHIIAIGNEKILPVAAVFGSNASGKSNVHEAFRYMAEYVISSFGYGGDESEKKNRNEILKPTPFLLDEKSRDSESSFEVYFISPEESGAKSYHYGFSVDQSGVCEEWLNVRPKTARGDFKRVFYRDGQKLDLPGIAAKSQENLQIALEKEVLLVSLGAKLKIEKLKLIRDWFLQLEFADFGCPVENFFLSRMLPDHFAESKEIQNKVVRYFSAFDSSIIGFQIKAVERGDEKKTQELSIDALHKMIGSDEATAIPLQLESAGTLKMFALYPLLQEVLEKGSVLFVDELNARLHPLLVRTFIITFLNPETNPNHAQLVFTTHDAWQLNNNILRRDEVWFTEKEDTGVSTLYSLADFVDEDGVKIRKDENYEKNYLLGKYGAIPSMKGFDMFKGDQA